MAYFTFAEQGKCSLMNNNKSDLAKAMDFLLIEAVALYHRAGIDYSMPLPDFLFLNYFKAVYRKPKYCSLVISNYWRKLVFHRPY